MKNVIKDLMDHVDYCKLTDDVFAFCVGNVRTLGFVVSEDAKDSMYVTYVNDCSKTRERPIRRRLFNKVVDSIIRRKETIKALFKEKQK